MLGREGHGRTEAIKMKNSQAAPYKPQSHPLSAGLSFPTSHLFLLGQGQCQHWKLEIRVFPGITFHQQELRLFPSFPVKQGCADPSKQEQFVCPRRKEMKQGGEALEKLLRQKQKRFDCWTSKSCSKRFWKLLCCWQSCKRTLQAPCGEEPQKTSPLKKIL